MEKKQGEMILRSLTLKNYRAFEELNVNLHDRLTVIVGSNGSGKTTILDAAAAALSVYISAFDGFEIYKISPDDVRAKSIKLGDMLNVQAQYPVEIQATAWVNYSHSKSRIIYENAPQNVKEIAPTQQVGNDYQSLIRIGEDIGVSIVAIPILAYYSTRRLWGDGNAKDLIDTTISRQDAYKDCLDVHLNLTVLKTRFELMTYEELKSGKKNKAFQTVKRAMAEVFGNVSGSTDTEVDMNLDTRGIEIKFTDSNNDCNCLTLNQLSDGYKDTICLIADIAYRMAVLNPQLEDRVLKETGGIVLIDEVELHLHPAWQQRILGDLREIFPKVQFIVTTNAPAVINTVKSESIRILENHDVRFSDGEVYGKDISSVTKGVMKAPERPNEVKEKFVAFYDALNDKRFDDAQSILDFLDQLLEDDYELVACHTKLSLKKRMQ